MTDSYLIWGILIFVSDLTAVIVYEGWKNWKNRRLDIACDVCELVNPLLNTPDKSAYLCRKCMIGYLEEHRDKFTEEQIKKAKYGYRKRTKAR